MGRHTRTWVQALVAFTSNANLRGFVKGKIWKGKSKQFCVPGLNCYSCPGALGACPIGSMQAVEGTQKYGVSLYVLGFLVFVGVLLGRFVCGFLCPFGWFQELLYKIPLRKRRVPKKAAGVLKYGKYVFLILFVILLPILAFNRLGYSVPFFCKYLCPAGTLEGGIPLLLANPTLRQAAGWLFSWKFLLLVLTVLASIVFFRPFCRFFCPLGAFYSLFNPVSVLHYEVDTKKCTRCGACSRACRMDVRPYKNPNDPECIRCGDCIRCCPEGAIRIQSLHKKAVSPEKTG